jgi:hypothetical protein
MSEKQKFEQAMSLLDDALNLLRDVRTAFAEIGVDIDSISDYGLMTSVILDAGIVTVSTSSGKKIDTVNDSNFGWLYIDGIRFSQEKNPVERQDRYA